MTSTAVLLIGKLLAGTMPSCMEAMVTQDETSEVYPVSEVVVVHGILYI